MSEAELPELQERCTRPIRADAPAGAPARDTPEFEALQAEIRKLELPNQPTPDWEAAVRLAASILEQKSKDLLVAAYLCVALLERDRFPGLATGLTILRDLIANFWQTLQPDSTRLRARVAAFEWLAERGAQRIGRFSEGGAPAESLTLCRERLDELAVLLEPRLESGGDLLGELRRAIEDTSARSAPSARAATPTTSAAAPGPGASGPASVQSSDELDRALAEARRLLRAAGDFLRRSDPKNPLGYRLPRIGVWTPVKQLPPHEGGKTKIPGFQPPDLLERLEQMLASGQPEALLEETEGRFPQAVLWLDLQRFAASALERMGEEFRPAADAICDELRFLLVRLPSLPELSFAEGAPLASPETRKWVGERVLAARSSPGAETGAGTGGGTAAVAAGATDGGGAAAFEEASREARVLLRARKLPEAVALLKSRAASAAGFVERARLKLEVARVCMEAGHHETAVAQLEALDEELRGSTIEDWAPALCVEVLRNLVLCRQRVLAALGSPPAGELVKARELLSRLCRLDVVAALELNGKR